MPKQMRKRALAAAAITTSVAIGATVAVLMPRILAERDNATRTSMSVDLERDLALVRAPKPHSHVVSAVELGVVAQGSTSSERKPIARKRRPAPVAHSSPVVQTAPVPRAGAQDERSAEAQSEIAPVPAAASAPEVVAPATSSEPSITIPAPTPGPSVGGAGDRGQGSGSNGGVGAVIGVIIRGGGVGDDHCKPRRGGPHDRDPMGVLDGIGGIAGGVIRIGGGRTPSGGGSAGSGRGPVFRPRR